MAKPWLAVYLWLPKGRRSVWTSREGEEHVLEAEQYQVYEAFNDAMDDSIDKACIRAMRRLTAKCILERADDFSLCGGISFRTLCEVQGTAL
eukprot:s803_g24.t1